MDLKTYFDKALAYDDYMGLLEDNLELHQLHYKKFAISPEDAKLIEGMNPIKILVLTEPWCGDSLAIFPVVRRIAELNKSWEVKILRRDENPELMDQFLTHNARAVPIFLFLAEDFHLLFRFGPRPQAAQAIFEEYREEFKAGKIDKKEVIKKIRNFYAKDRGKAILSDLLSAFKENRLL